MRHLLSLFLFGTLAVVALARENPTPLGLGKKTIFVVSNDSVAKSLVRKTVTVKGENWEFPSNIVEGEYTTAAIQSVTTYSIAHSSGKVTTHMEVVAELKSGLC